MNEGTSRKPKTTDELEISCDLCGEKFLRKRSEIERRKNHFCSKKCQVQWMKEFLIKEKRYNFSKVEVVCDCCGKKKLSSRSQAEKYKTHFCDRKCHAKWKSENSHGENHPNWTGNNIVNCYWCGKEIRIPIYMVDSDQRRFCSRKCLGEWSRINNKGERSPNWKGGKTYEFYPETFNKKFKQEIRERDHFRCQICGHKDKKLSVHHIDYDKYNGDRSNLVSLCRKCHGKTNHNRENWLRWFRSSSSLWFSARII